MKNNRIRNAYDSINPGPAQKQQMLDAILSSADLKESPRQSRRTREPVVYTAKQSTTHKRTNIFGTLAAGIVLVLVAGFGISFLMNRESINPVADEPTSDITVPMATAGDHYAPVLEKYRRAMAEGWTKEQCEIEGISTRMQAGYDVTKAGFAMLDLDGDGREELIIAEGSLPHMDVIWDLYTTLEDGTPIQILVDECDGDQYYLYETNVIGMEYTDKTQGSYLYHILENGQLALLEGLEYENDRWVYIAEGKTNEISPEQAMIISDGYKHFKLNLTSFADISDDFRNPGAMEQYRQTIEKYKTAIEEGWDRTMCNANGMSMLTPIESAEESLFYALYDLNGDGTEELIISEYPHREDTDTSFIDIYTLYNGEVKNAMSMFELAGMRSLCEGGFVKDLFMEPGMEYDKYAGFLKLEADRFVTDFKVYQKDGKWFTEGNRGVGESISREEADAIVAQYPPLKLDYTEIKSTGEVEYQSGYEAFDHIIQKYVTAINEGWAEHQCEQNDISPDIFADTTISYKLGWCLVDIDSNGVEELVISDGVHLFDLYVMMPHDGTPGHLICANGGESWQLCENNVIQNQGRYSGTTAWRHYTLKDTDIIQKDIVFYDGQLNQYYYGTNGEDLDPVSKDKAGDIICSSRTAELSLIPFAEPETFDPDEMEYYDPVLDIYRQAVQKNWNPGECMENGISLMIGYYGELYGELGYSLMDLDGNGIEELIITDGSDIFDLYTIIQDEETGPLHLVSAMERITYDLLKDFKIYCAGSGGAARQYHTLYELQGSALVVLEGYAFDADTDPNNPWYFFDGETVGDSCGSFDPQTVINNYIPIAISKIPIS